MFVELLLLGSQLFFSLIVAIVVFVTIQTILTKARWDLCHVHQQAFVAFSGPVRRLLGFVMLAAPLTAKFAKPSLAVRRKLAVLGMPAQFDDLLFARLRWSFMLLWVSLACIVIGFAVALNFERLMRWTLLVSLIGAMLSMVLPYAWLRDQTMAARRGVLRGFPTFLDVLALVLESGQNFQSALQLSVQRLSGRAGDAALKRQLQELSQDIRAGQSKAVALQRFSDRLDLPEVTQFTASIKAADQQGVSVTALLRRQAEQLRTSRALAAERQAMKLPVKLLLPLAVCIFPCTFLILAFPLVMRLSNSGLF